MSLFVGVLVECKQLQSSLLQARGAKSCMVKYMLLKGMKPLFILLWVGSLIK